jgi:hypothetical protein
MAGRSGGFALPDCEISGLMIGKVIILNTFYLRQYILCGKTTM